MANALPTEKKIAVISSLCEGSSIRSIERITGVHRDAVMVEVFRLKGHPKTDRVYAWSHDTDDPAHPKRHVTVLHLPPVVSPQTAVQAAIFRDFRDHAQAN